MVKNETAEVAGIAPRELLAIGDTRQVQGTRAKPYTLKRCKDGQYSCDCPSWAFQRSGVRTCKHLKELLGEDYENMRCSTGAKLEAMSDDEEADHSPVKKAKRKPAAAKPRKAKAAKTTKGGKKKSIYVEEEYDEEDDENDLLLPRGVLLAEKWDLEGDNDPKGYFTSEKLDGVRAHWTGSIMQSRNGKRFNVPKSLTDRLPKNVQLDGELYGNERDAFDVTSGIIRSGARGDSDSRWEKVSYLVFDVIGSAAPVEERWEIARKLVPDGEMAIDAVCDSGRSCISLVPQVVCTGKEHLLDMLKDIEAVGGEGLMLREPKSAYVSGRSHTLLKVKSFYTAYALVVGHNAGKGRLDNMLGSLQLQMANGTTFDCGSGLNDALRAAFEPVMGSIVAYSFQELSKDGVPRFPAYKGVSADKTKPRDAIVRSINLRDKKEKARKKEAEDVARLSLKKELKSEASGSGAVKRE